MDSNLKYGMEDFLVEAQETLDNVNLAAKATTRASNFLKWLIALTVLVFLGLYTDIKIGLSSKADAHEVVYKQNAMVVDKLRLTNQQRNFALVVDTSTTMEIIKSNNQNYLFVVDGIYSINYRGE